MTKIKMLPIAALASLFAAQTLTAATVDLERGSDPENVTLVVDNSASEKVVQVAYVVRYRDNEGREYLKIQGNTRLPGHNIYRQAIYQRGAVSWTFVKLFER
jgi:hypothetical protein